ncbi:dermonecrotic toxin domain-containing protein [Pseudomonas sp. GB2N2]
MYESSTPSTVDVLTQLVTGPSLTEVASKALSPALKKLYPELEIDPQLAMVVTPNWVIEGDDVFPGPYQVESLTDILVRLGLSGTTVTLIDGEHFLTLQPTLERATKLPVKIEAIGLLINELAPLLFVAYQEQQLDYWSEPTRPGEPRWYQLSDSLRNLWNVDKSLGWDADQQAMAKAVYTLPDKQQRQLTDTYKTRACLIDIDQQNGAVRTHLDVLDTAVLVGSLGDRTLILTHSVTRGFLHFDSFDALGQALEQSHLTSATGSSLNWRLFEPEGNFFDTQACTLIALEADAIGAINFFQDSSKADLYPHLGTAGQSNEPPARLKPHFDGLQPLLPPWLDTASATDQSNYSRHLMDLTVVQHRNDGKTFQGEITDIHAFTLEALGMQMLKDHPQSSTLKLDNIEINITSLVVWGTFVLPGQTDTLTLSLTELALQNLAGLPWGSTTVNTTDGIPVPSWMTADYLKKLVTAVDIGATYPAMLQNRLLDNLSQARELKRLYTVQLPAELTLLALQHKIRGKAGFDEQGYRYVVAAFGASATDRQVDGQEIVIRPLAFIPPHRADTTPDKVANMFIIGPRQADKGPCVLYRPLLNPPLLQYPSESNLLYAITHSRSLRESVLAWLPDKARFNYSQYVFPAKLPSIWTVPQLLVDPTIALDMRGPVSLSASAIEKDLLDTLFTATVQAMIAQADRQSVSNVEARWSTLKQGGWLMFNAALPFLGRTVGAAAWIWQMMDDLQGISDAGNEQEAMVDWTALSDILMALGMVLAHRAATRTRSARPSVELVEKTVTPEKPVPENIKTVRLPDITSVEPTHETSLNAIGAWNRSRPGMAALLDDLKIPQPDELGEPVQTGDHQHLQAHDHKWYAQVGERWFEVQINDSEQVQIIDSRQQPARIGPLLTRTASGQWVVDLRLRLRGGGLGSRRKKMQQANRANLNDKRTVLTAFDNRQDTMQKERAEVRKLMLDALPDAAASARKTFLDKMDAQFREYEEHIQELKALNRLEPIPNYRTAMIDRLSLQLFLTQSWLGGVSEEFRGSLSTTLALVDEEIPLPSAERVAPFEKMTDLTQGMIDKIETAHSLFAALSLLGKEAVEVSLYYRKKLPRYSLNDLKLLQVSLGRELCLRTEPRATPEAGMALENLINDAALNVQSFLELSDDDSLLILGERIETLSSLAEQFAVIDQRFLDIVDEFPAQMVNDRLNQVRVRIAGFNNATMDQLANLLREQRLVEPVAGPSRPQAPTKKIIKTRYKGTLIGEPRKDTEGLVDVKEPLTGKITTFHEKTPGVWVVRVTAKAPALKVKSDLAKSVGSGQALLDELPAFHRRIDAHASGAQRIPVEMEDMYRLHGVRLREAGEAIDSALTALNLINDPATSAGSVSKRLDTAATALYEKGLSTRVQMIKQQPPTAARIEWLKGKKEVEISKKAARRRLKGPRKDYLDEYEVLDNKTRKVLWYAHFHYADASAAAGSFTAAHLKTPAQRLLGGGFDVRGNSNQELIAIYRSEISRTLATSVFFS